MSDKTREPAVHTGAAASAGAAAVIQEQFHIEFINNDNYIKHLSAVFEWLQEDYAAKGNPEGHFWHNWLDIGKIFSGYELRLYRHSICQGKICVGETENGLKYRINSDGITGEIIINNISPWDDNYNLFLKNIAPFFPQILEKITEQQGDIFNQHKSSQTMVALNERQEVIGFMCINDIKIAGGAKGCLEYVQVKEEYRRQGIFKKMLNNLTAKYKGQIHLSAWVIQQSTEIFSSDGWKETEEVNEEEETTKFKKRITFTPALALKQRAAEAAAAPESVRNVMTPPAASGETEEKPRIKKARIAGAAAAAATERMVGPPLQGLTVAAAALPDLHKQPNIVPKPT